MTEAFKARIRNEVAAYSRYMTHAYAVRRVKRNYLGRLDMQIDAAIKGSITYEYVHRGAKRP